MSTTLNRILYVEDEPDLRAIVQVALETLGGFEVKVCSCAETALREAAEFEPDALLLDVMMPGMDGPSLLHALHGVLDMDQLPVIFVTAKAQPTEIAHFRSMGARGVITKPFDPMTLSDEVKALCAI